MKKVTAALIIVFLSVACSAKERLEMPPIPEPPSNWKAYNWSTISGTICPKLAGEYSEPPLINRSGKEAGFIPNDSFDLYSSYIPFHLGERRELESNDLNLVSDHFVIQQPDSTQFYFVYLNEQTGFLVEYRFRASEGDYECKGGYIEFPIYSTFGMIEGRTVNFQIRNIVVKDESGAFVIQSTRGPSRETSTNSINEFLFEFFQYPKVEKYDGSSAEK